MKINLSDKNHLIIDDSAVFQPDTKIITSDGCEIVLKSPFTICGLRIMKIISLVAQEN